MCQMAMLCRVTASAGAAVSKEKPAIIDRVRTQELIPRTARPCTERNRLNTTRHSPFSTFLDPCWQDLRGSGRGRQALGSSVRVSVGGDRRGVVRVRGGRRGWDYPGVRMQAVRILTCSAEAHAVPPKVPIAVYQPPRRTGQEGQVSMLRPAATPIDPVIRGPRATGLGLDGRSAG
jgi:hypothetical protein